MIRGLWRPNKRFMTRFSPGPEPWRTLKALRQISCSGLFWSLRAGLYDSVFESGIRRHLMGLRKDRREVQVPAETGVLSKSVSVHEPGPRPESSVFLRSTDVLNPWCCWTLTPEHSSHSSQCGSSVWINNSFSQINSEGLVTADQDSVNNQSMFGAERFGDARTSEPDRADQKTVY